VQTLYTNLVKNGTNTRRTNWITDKKTRISLYYFPNAKTESDVKFSEISDESFQKMCMNESYQEIFSLCVNCISWSGNLV